MPEVTRRSPAWISAFGERKRSSGSRPEPGAVRIDLGRFWDSQAETAALADALNALHVVERAEPAARPVRPPVTPSFVSRQGYRGSPASTGGIDADFAQTIAGGTGANVTIVDLEYDWNRNHEDLSKLRGRLRRPERDRVPRRVRHRSRHGRGR